MRDSAYDVGAVRADGNDRCDWKGSVRPGDRQELNEFAESVCWLPALCRKKDMPSCTIKVSLCRLGKFMHEKTAPCIALPAVRKEDSSESDRILHFQGAVKSKHVVERRERALLREVRRKSVCSSREAAFLYR